MTCDRVYGFLPWCATQHLITLSSPRHLSHRCGNKLSIRTSCLGVRTLSERRFLVTSASRSQEHLQPLPKAHMIQQGETIRWVAGSRADRRIELKIPPGAQVTTAS